MMSYLVLFAVLLTGALPATELAFKCGSQPAGSAPLYALDGRILAHKNKAVLEDVGKDNVYAIVVVCMNPTDSTFNRSIGVPVVSIWTKTGPAARMKPLLDAIVEAQDTYHRANSVFADVVHKIKLPEYPGQFRITLTVREGGWFATITMDRYLTTCSIFDGDVHPPHAATIPREPGCVAKRGFAS